MRSRPERLLVAAPEVAAGEGLGARAPAGAHDERFHRRRRGSSCLQIAAAVAAPGRCGASWQQVFLLVALVVDGRLFAGATEGGEFEDADSATEDVSRRLEGLIDRHVSFQREEAASLDERGFLPALDIGGMRLKEVFVVNTLEPWKCRHAKIPPDYQARPTARRLHELSAVPNTPLKFDTPRDRVRIMTALNAAAHPPAAYNASELFKEAVEVYRLGKQVFWEFNDTSWTELNESTAQSDSNGNGSNTSNGTYNFTPQEIEQIRTYDVDELVKTRAALRTAIDKKWASDSFLGQRAVECTSLTPNDPRCFNDIGLSISVYDDEANQVLVFHSGFAQKDNDYLMWLHRLWILENFEDKLLLEWSTGAQQKVTKAMLERRAGPEFERHVRCAFKDMKYSIAPDIEALAKAADVPGPALKEQGLWVLVKKIVRVILPEERPKQIAKTIYLTGSGTGGMHAAFASMWLAKADDTKYDTYVIAGVGWECAARRLLSKDISTFQEHKQLHVYSHVADAYATALDLTHGNVCLFGVKNLSGSPAQEFCSKAIGHSGPELLYRGPPPETNKEETPTKEMIAGQQNFDACHYYTHSAWYAAMLFMDDSVLMLDGRTDGGCGMREPIPQTDRLQQCPLETHADEECKLLLVKQAKLPVVAMLITALSMTGFICSCGLCGICCLSRVKSDKHLYAEQGARRPFPFCCIPPSKDGMDRAKQARERAKEKRQKEIEKRYGAAAVGKEADGDGKKKKKKKNKDGEPEAELLGDSAEVDGEDEAATKGAEGNETTNATAERDKRENKLSSTSTTEPTRRPIGDARSAAGGEPPKKLKRRSKEKEKEKSTKAKSEKVHSEKPANDVAANE